MTDHYGGPKESLEERRRMLDSMSLCVKDLFDTSKPWVLVPNGSILGYFDWVPERLRLGPWSPLAAPFLFVLVYAFAMGIIWRRKYSTDIDLSDLEYPAVNTALWYQSLVCFICTSIVSAAVILGPAGINAWGTYSMWTWSTVHLRCGLTTIACFLPKESFLFSVLEYSRLPSLLMSSIVFVFWNFLIAPFVYFVGMDTPTKKARFVEYFSNWRLIQLHLCNIVYAVADCVVASPPRSLHSGDYVAAFSVALAYIFFYFLVLDRIGVHLYPIFSPRTSWMIVSWTILLIAYVTGFFVWDSIISSGRWRQTVLDWYGVT